MVAQKNGKTERAGHWKMPAPRTERLVLRPPEPGDAEAIAALANDLRIAEMTARIPHPYTLNDARRFVAAVGGVDLPAETFLAVCAAAPDTLVGVCGIEPAADDVVEIGYWIGVPYWGRGYATEAVRAVIDRAFERPATAAIAASCRIVNPASRRVLEKCGFQLRGEAMVRSIAAGGMVPVLRFVLERSIWAGLKSWRVG